MRLPDLSPRAAIGATLAMSVIWGTSFSVNDAGLRAMDPYTFAFLRFVLSAGAMLAVAAVTEGVHAELIRSPRVWIVGVLNAACFGFQYTGQCWTTPARAALIINSSVVLVAILERFLLGEPLGRGRAVAVAGAFGGAALLSLAPGQSGACGSAWWGDALIGVSAFAIAFYVIASREAIGDRAGHAGERRILAFSAWSYVVTMIALAPTLLLSPRPLHVGPGGLPLLLYAGLVTGALAYTVWTWTLRSVSATVSSVVVLAEVAVAIVISLALRRETFAPIEAAGALLLLASIGYVSFAPPRRSDSRDEPS
ncbi:MAG: DMT family transporter [Thermoplasmatota archaeon]